MLFDLQLDWHVGHGEDLNGHVLPRGAEARRPLSVQRMVRPSGQQRSFVNVDLRYCTYAHANRTGTLYGFLGYFLLCLQYVPATGPRWGQGYNDL